MIGDCEYMCIGGGLADGDGVRGNSDNGGLSTGDDFGTTVRISGPSSCDDDDEDDRNVRPSLL